MKRTVDGYIIDYVINDMAKAPYPGACVEEYMSWFRSVSHPYVIHAEDDERPLLVPSDARGHEAHPEESHLALVCL